MIYKSLLNVSLNGIRQSSLRFPEMTAPSTPYWLKWRLMMFLGERKVVDFLWMTFQVSSILSVMGKLLCQDDLFHLFLREIWLRHRQVQRDLMTVLAPPCSVATPVQETGLRAPSFQGAAFHTWEIAGPRLDAQGACFQHPRGGVEVGRGRGLLKTFQTLRLRLLLIHSLPSTFCSFFNSSAFREYLLCSKLGARCLGHFSMGPKFFRVQVET